MPVHRLATVLLASMAACETAQVQYEQADVVVGALGSDPAASPSDVGPEPTVRISPASPRPGDALRCLSDVPGTVRWELDGSDARIDGPEVPAGVVDAYQTWTCLAETVRGAQSSDSVEAAETCGSLRVVDPLVAPYRADHDLIGSSWTVEAWVRPGAEVEGVRTVMSRGDDFDTSDEALDFALRIVDGGAVELVRGGTGPCAVVSAAASLGDGWHHLAGTFDADTGDSGLWVDGVQVATCTDRDRPAIAYGDLVLGGRRDDAGMYEVFDGWLDEVRITRGLRYDGAFQPARYPSADAETVWLLHFNEGTASEPAIGHTLDLSGHGLDLTLPVGAVVPDLTASACDVPPSP